MIFLKLLLNTLLLTIGAVSLLTEEMRDDPIFDTSHLQNYITPQHYDINISLKQFFQGANKFSGTCIIHIKIDKPTSAIIFHAQKPQIEIPNSAHLVEKNSNKTYVLSKYPLAEISTYDISFYESYEFKEKVPIGNYSIHIAFNSSLDDDGGFFKTSYTSSAGNKKWLIATQSFRARQLFPCWDHPLLKATFNISIQHPTSYIALSNTLLSKITKENDEMQWTHFKTTPTISTHNIGFMLFSRYFKFYNCGLNILCRIQSKSRATYAKEVFNMVTINYQNWKLLRGDSNVRHVAIPGFRYNGMEKWKLIFYRERAILYDSVMDPIGQQIEVARLITHKAIYQRLDNLRNSAWPYCWLNKAVATLLGSNINSEYLLRFRMVDLFVVQIQQESLRLNSDLFTSLTLKDLYQKFDISFLTKWYSPSDINVHLSFFYYIKAPAILRMLQYIVSDKVFRNGIEIFYNMSTHTQSTTLDDFWDSMQKAHDKNTMKIPYIPKLNIKKIMDPWTELKCYPILTIKQRNNSLIIMPRTIRQCYSDLHKELDIFVIATKESAPNFTLSTNLWKHFVVLISIKYRFYDYYFPHNSNEWIIVNLQQIGYYRVNYEVNNWLNIARYLNDSTKYKKIHVLNRAQIIDDAYYFVKTKQMSLPLFLKLTEYLSHETDYVPWYPMFKALEDMSIIFLFPDKEYEKINILKSLYMLMQHIKYDETPNDNELTKCLRQEAVKWLCVLDDPECKKVAEIKLRKYLEHPEKNEILPWWKEWMYYNGLAKASDITWNKVLEGSQWNSRKELLKILSYSEDFVRIKSALLAFKILTRRFPDEIQEKDHLNYFHHIIRKHARNETMLGYILKNLKDVIPKQSNTIVVLIDIINHVYSEAALNMVIKIVENSLRKEIIYTDEHNLIYLPKIWVQNLQEKIISLIHNKINIRSSQIKREMNRFDFVEH